MGQAIDLNGGWRPEGEWGIASKPFCVAITKLSSKKAKHFIRNAIQAHDAGLPFGIKVQAEKIKKDHMILKVLGHWDEKKLIGSKTKEYTSFLGYVPMEIAQSFPDIDQTVGHLYSVNPGKKPKDCAISIAILKPFCIMSDIEKKHHKAHMNRLK